MGVATQPAGLTSPAFYPGAGRSAVLELVVTVKTKELPLQPPGGCVGAKVSEECKPVHYHIRDISKYVLYSFQLERKRKHFIVTSDTGSWAVGRGKKNDHHHFLQMAAGLKSDTSVPRGLSYSLLSSVTLSLRARPSPDVVTHKQVALSIGSGDLREVSALRGRARFSLCLLIPRPSQGSCSRHEPNPNLLSYKSDRVWPDSRKSGPW